MLDFTHIPNGADKQIFYAQSGSWQTWYKPRGAKIVNILCVGAGGGGAPGRTGDENSYNWGGGGGASGGITKLTIPASIIPDILYIQVGIGGRGGKSAVSSDGTIGTKGIDSLVSLFPSNSYNSVICISPGGNAGSISTDSGNGYGAGGVSTTYSPSNALFIRNGIYYFEPTVAGRRASTVADGSGAHVYALTSSVLTGGAGGGSGITTLGGNVYASSVFLLSTLLSPPQGSARPSPDGYGLLSPILCGVGGVGGNGGLGSADGCKGGNGFIGCGGGGGGGTYNLVGSGTLFRGGDGGDGGDGIVIITTST